MKKLRAVELTIVGTLVTGVAMTTSVLAANTGYKMSRASIWFNGSPISTPYHLAAPDAGHLTAYIPIFYVQQLLNEALNLNSNQDTWDGSSRKWTMTVSGVTEIPQMAVCPTEAQISVNGKEVESAPALVAVDPDSGQRTTYMPIWYVQQLVDALLGTGAVDAWHGNYAIPQWDVATQADATTIQPLPGTSSPTPANSVQTKALDVINGITWTDAGGYRTFSLPIYTVDSGWELSLGMSDQSTQSGVPVQYSLDNGRTWVTPTNEYDSLDNTQGGVSSIPSGVSRVLVRGPVGCTAAIGFMQVGNTSSQQLAEYYVLPDGTKKITLQGG